MKNSKYAKRSYTARGNVDLIQNVLNDLYDDFRKSNMEALILKQELDFLHASLEENLPEDPYNKVLDGAEKLDLEELHRFISTEDMQRLREYGVDDEWVIIDDVDVAEEYLDYGLPVYILERDGSSREEDSIIEIDYHLTEGGLCGVSRMVAREYEVLSSDEDDEDEDE